MRARVLDRLEWPRLADTDAAVLVPFLTPAARVVVVEDEGVLIGCQVLQPVLHAEGLWVHPDHRSKAGVLRRLWREVRATVRDEFHVGWFATGCASDEVQHLLAILGAVKLPDHYMVSVDGRKETPCQPS